MIFSFLRNTGSSPKQLFEFLQSGVVIQALRRCLRTRSLTIYHSAAVSFLPPKDNTVNIQGRKGAQREDNSEQPLRTSAPSAVDSLAPMLCGLILHNFHPPCGCLFVEVPARFS